jgi:hypothetical protein
MELENTVPADTDEGAASIALYAMVPVVVDADGYPHEYAVEVPRQYTGDTEPRIMIGISASGGGTVGDAYANNGWQYTVMVSGEAIITGDDIRSGGIPATHARMAESLCNFLSAAGESLYHRDGESEYSDEYSDEQRAFLTDAYERFTMFGTGG